MSSSYSIFRTIFLFMIWFFPISNSSKKWKILKKKLVTFRTPFRVQFCYHQTNRHTVGRTLLDQLRISELPFGPILLSSDKPTYRETDIVRSSQNFSKIFEKYFDKIWILLELPPWSYSGFIRQIDIQMDGQNFTWFLDQN